MISRIQARSAKIKIPKFREHTYVLCYELLRFKLHGTPMYCPHHHSLSVFCFLLLQTVDWNKLQICSLMMEVYHREPFPLETPKCAVQVSCIQLIVYCEENQQCKDDDLTNFLSSNFTQDS